VCHSTRPTAQHYSDTPNSYAYAILTLELTDSTAVIGRNQIMFIFYHVSTNVGNFEIILSQKILKHNNMFNKETQRDAFAQKNFSLPRPWIGIEQYFRLNRVVFHDSLPIVLCVPCILKCLRHILRNVAAGKLKWPSRSFKVISNNQWCKQYQILKTKSKTKTNITRPRPIPRPPEVNKGTWWI